MNDEELVKLKLKKTIKGWNMILDIHKECRDAAVLIIPKESSDILDIILRYLDRFASMYPQTFILTTLGLPDIKKYTNKSVSVVKINDEEMEAVLLYAAGTSDMFVRMLSLTVSNIRDATKLIGFKGISIDEIVCRGMYGITGGEIDGR